MVTRVSFVQNKLPGLSFATDLNVRGCDVRVLNVRQTHLYKAAYHTAGEEYRSKQTFTVDQRRHES